MYYFYTLYTHISKLVTKMLAGKVVLSAQITKKGR